MKTKRIFFLPVFVVFGCGEAEAPFVGAPDAGAQEILPIEEGAEAESESESEPESEPGSEAEAESESESESEPESEPDPGPESDPVPEPETDPESDPKSEPDPASDPDGSPGETSSPASASVICGDGQCDASESATTCTADCGCTATDAFLDPCDVQAPGGCFCDDLCVSRNDCCPDACDVCGSCDPEFGFEPLCGDGYCDTSETAVTCTEDCGCAVVRGLFGGCTPPLAPGGCLCDEGCVARGDCCPDACSECGACVASLCGDDTCDITETAADCTEDCGCAATEGFLNGCDDQAPEGCWCDYYCVSFGDCCPDACTICGACGSSDWPDEPPCGDGFCDSVETALGCTEDCGCAAVEGFFGGCDDQAPDGCYCDDMCLARADCCPDACAECGTCD